MKVKYLNEKDECPFRDITPGNAFCYVEEIFIKVGEGTYKGHYAMSVCNGDIIDLNPDVLVEPIDAELTIQKRI